MILFGLKIGIKSFLKGDFKIALKRLVLPINYWRVTIFQIVSNFICNIPGIEENQIRILDIGSPKLLSLFFASRINGTIIASDLQDKAIFTEWQKYGNHGLKKRNLIFEFANAKKLQYPEKYFDVIYSLSVVHMITPAEDGDVAALKEIQLKIKNNGFFILEIPFRNEFCMNFASRNNFEEHYSGTPLFKERQYNENAIKTRISENIQGDLVEKVILYERFPFDKFWTVLPQMVKTFLAFVEPWVDMMNISIAKEERQFSRGKSAVLIYRIRG
jgi:ubiquinone/menaquinone biosynthesis C-methylase UbiE